MKIATFVFFNVKYVEPMDYGYDKNINNIDDLLCPINRRSYIANHANYGGPDSVFTKEQHNRILELIEKHILATRDN